MSDTVIQVENLSKQYRLGVINHHTLSRDLQSWWARVRGRDDPNSPVRSTLELKNRCLLNPHDSDDQLFWALQDVSFEAGQGDRIGIVGRNGAGKSTLLKILSRITEPTTGRIRIRGRVASLLEVGTGFHPELTGRENIFLNGAILGMSRAEIRKRFDDIVDFSEIGTFLDTPVKRYSSGMYVRLAFAVAAHLESEILIVDEVLAVGDAAFQKKCLGKMEEVGSEGRTVLFVSHNMESVRKLCNKGIHIENGHAFFFSDFDDCINSYLGRTVQNLQPIASHCTKLSEKLEVSHITINGSSDDVVTLLAGSRPVEVEISGTVHSRTRVAFEARFSDSSDHAIGIFSPGHFSDYVQYLDPGPFRIRSSISFPALTQGDYYLSFFLTDPGVEGLLDFPGAVRLMAESEPMTTTGGVLENRRGHGAIILGGTVDYGQGHI